MSVSYGEGDEMFAREGTQMEVEKFTLSDFNAKLIVIFDTANSMREYNNVRDHIKQVILDDLIREDGERMQSKDVLDDDTLYNKSFSLNSTLKHDQLSSTFKYLTCV